MVEWTVQQLAQRAGISGRALRHYHQIGLLTPDRIGANGYRYYGPTSVARLQRILLLRDAGVSLDEIATVLDSEHDQADEVAALEKHLVRLRRDREALDRRIASVEHTIAMRRQGRLPRMDMMLEGFNDRYKTEVVSRWGQEAFDASNQWWHAKTLAIEPRGTGPCSCACRLVRPDPRHPHPCQRPGQRDRHGARHGQPLRHQSRLPSRLRKLRSRRLRGPSTTDPRQPNLTLIQVPLRAARRSTKGPHVTSERCPHAAPPLDRRPARGRPRLAD